MLLTCGHRVHGHVPERGAHLLSVQRPDRLVRKDERLFVGGERLRKSALQDVLAAGDAAYFFFLSMNDDALHFGSLS